MPTLLWDGTSLLRFGGVLRTVECPGDCCGVTGACCLPDSTCDIRTFQSCTDAGGIYRGDGTTCSPSPCTGACCTSGNCSVVHRFSCSGQWQGFGTPCVPNPCPTPPPTCCNGTRPCYVSGPPVTCTLSVTMSGVFQTVPVAGGPCCGINWTHNNSHTVTLPATSGCVYPFISRTGLIIPFFDNCRNNNTTQSPVSFSAQLLDGGNLSTSWRLQAGFGSFGGAAVTVPGTCSGASGGTSTSFPSNPSRCPDSTFSFSASVSCTGVSGCGGQANQLSSSLYVPPRRVLVAQTMEQAISGCGGCGSASGGRIG